jgi:hypothetical protein
MTSPLMSDAEVAAKLGIDDLAKFHTLRRYNGWPFTEVGRGNVRFTDEQFAEIVAMQTRRPKVSPIKPADGQTKKSASRKRAS